MSTVAAEAIKRKMERRGLELDPTTNEWVPKGGIAAAPQDGGEPQSLGNQPAQGVEDRLQQPAAPQEPDWKAEHDKLQQQMNALMGRVAPAQRDADTFRNLYETSTREKQELADRMNALQTQLEEARTTGQRKSIEAQIDELLDEEDRETIDPAVLKIMGKLTAGLFSKQNASDPTATIEQVLAQREQKATDTYRRGLMADPERGVSRIVSLSQDAKFMNYVSDHPELDSTINNFLTANDRTAIDRYAKATDRLLAAYEDSQKAPKPPTRASDPAGSQTLAAALERQPRQRLSEEEVRKLTTEYKMHVRNRNHQKAAAVMAQLENL
jgi:hypothetical protein